MGVTALLIASKYEEIYPPELKDFVFITDNAYTKEDVLQMEFLILNALSFDVTFPTTHRFLERYTKLLRTESNSPVLNYAYFLVDLALIDLRMLQYSCSLLAASALGHAYKTLTQGSFPAQSRSQQPDSQVELQLAQCLGVNAADL